MFWCHIPKMAVIADPPKRPQNGIGVPHSREKASAVGNQNTVPLPPLPVQISLRDARRPALGDSKKRSGSAAGNRQWGLEEAVLLGGPMDKVTTLAVTTAHVKSLSYQTAFWAASRGGDPGPVSLKYGWPHSWLHGVQNPGPHLTSTWMSTPARRRSVTSLASDTASDLSRGVSLEMRLQSFGLNIGT